MKKLLSVLFITMLSFSHHSFAKEKLSIENATLRAPIPGMANTAGYMTLTNTSEKDIVLVDASSEVAAKVEYHNHIMQAGVMKMVKLDKLVIPAGETITFQSGGLHLMFIDLNKEEKLSHHAAVKLISEQGDEFPIKLMVKSIKQQHHHHH